MTKDDKESKEQARDEAPTLPDGQVRVWGGQARPPEVRDEAPTPAAGEPLLAGRYIEGLVVGRGGMGTVVLQHDTLVGRDVAMKTLRPGAGETLRRRFVREARIQGQLEHPAVVPVYDVGALPDGTPYFTMKRVGGLTLSQLLEALRKKDEALSAKYTVRKRLTDFVSACRALELAHARGVVHRDLKPANIMLGDFGEVYVLDWGIARVEAGDPDAGREPASSGEPWRAAAGDTPVLVDGARTVDGAILGTPGYMAPEQIQGRTDVDARADIYSLGVILFELLTLEPLHEGFNYSSVVQSTLHGPSEMTGRLERAPTEIGPELRAICRRATHPDRDERYPSLHALIEDIERYLDGDRDLEHRRALAEEHAQKASDVARMAVHGFDVGEAERREAVLDATRALALDPDHLVALRALMALVLARPKKVPAEVQESLRREDLRTTQSQARSAVVVFALWLLLIPTGVALGARDWVLLGVVAVSLLTQLGIAWLGAKEPGHRTGILMVAVVANAVGLVATSRFISPLLLIPAMTVATTLMYLLSPAATRPWAITTVGVVALGVAFGLDLSGVVPATVAVTEHSIEISPAFDQVREGLSLAAYMATVLAILVGSAIVLLRMRKELSEARLQVHLNAWQLGQIVPEGAHSLLTTPPGRSDLPPPWAGADDD